MATVGYNNGGREGQSAVNRSEADRRRRQVRVAQSFANRRLSAALMTPPVVVDDVPADQNLKVMLQKDILNIVETPSGGAIEIEFVRDADGGLRAFVVIP